MENHTTLAPLAGRLLELPPSCGPVRLVGVDGHAGSGKSTFACRLSDALGGAPIVHLDDLATHREPFGWPERLRRQVLAPLGRGAEARYQVYDWVAGCFASWARLPAAPVALLEGVGAGRRGVRPYLASVLWMDLPGELSWARGRHRDGPGLTEFWDGWTRAETAHFAADPSRPYADALVRQHPDGYRILPGPAPARRTGSTGRDHGG